MEYTQVYAYWGIELKQTFQYEHIGTCPFCKRDKFYVDVRLGGFDCKRCGKQGGYKTFLNYIYQEALEQTTELDYTQLSNHRNIPKIQLLKWKVAKWNKRWLLPCFNNNKELEAVRVWQLKRKEASAAGCNVTLVNIENFHKSETIYITESYFNAIALDWLLERNRKHGVTTSTCGANNFKDNWIEYFRNKDVIIVFDNDDAGYGILNIEKSKATGSRKIASRLLNVARTVKYVTWPKTYKEGYDIRDLTKTYFNKPTEGWRLFQSFIGGKHRDDKVEVTVVSPNKASTENITYKELIRKFDSYAELNNNLLRAIDMSLAVAISVNLPGKCNPWGFLEGPPGCGKSMILETFEASRRIIWESTVTSKALVSGFNLGRNTLDPSILARVNNCCLVLKDFTEVLSLPQAERDAVFGILRGAFDGRVKRPFGTGVRQYICDFSLLAGVTSEIKAHSTASLGERFLRYKIDKQNDEENIQTKAFESQLFGSVSLDDLKQAVKNFLDLPFDYSPESLIGRLPQWFKDKVNPLARLAGALRTTVKRHDRGPLMGQVVYVPDWETGNRLGIQFNKLCVCLSLIQDTPQIKQEHYSFLRQIFFDTIDSIQSKIVIRLLEENRPLTREALSDSIGLPSLGVYLDDLKILDIIEIDGKNSNNKVLYAPTKVIRDLWHRSMN